jgi:hypothetical protein
MRMTESSLVEWISKRDPFGSNELIGRDGARKIHQWWGWLSINFKLFLDFYVNS